MKKRIPKPFALLLFFYFLSNYLSASPDCPIVTARFQLSDGTTSNPSANGWYLNATNVASTGYFAVKSNRLHAQELGGEGIWYSRVFSNPGYAEFQVAVKVSSEGDMNSSEYVKIYYKINGGAETLLDQRTGNFGTIDFISPVLTGNNVQLVVKIYNYNNGGSQTSKYYIEEYRMFKEKGPCTVSPGITVTAAAANGGALTCASPSLRLSATATGTGTTTWSWSGPNGYTSTLQNPVITAAGTYTVVAANSTGTGSASVTVTENKTAPVITATGGALACGSCVTISATSNVSGATYSWLGPNNFTSTAQNPTVCAAGTYTVTVTNPANGCSAQQPVTVSASAISTLWLEDFTGLSNGATADAGATAWTSASTGSAGTYSVQNNEFKISYTGQAVSTWTSEAIDISSKTNVSFSVALRSEVASTSDAFETTDYIRVYYKLNGGAETLVYEDFAGIGSTTNTTGSITVSSPALAGSTLQVIIKASNSDPTERYFFDNIKVTGSNTGATTITPAVTGTVTCTATAQLSATASDASGTVTAWSWTGPNGFTSSLQDPVVNTGGQYIVTATLSSGCTASATITVPENKTAPDITATGGTLACLPGITLNVHSSISDAVYSWTGPNGFTSMAKNPTVSVAGVYTATVTNPANGCSASQQVTVTAGGTTATIWSENFTLANGTTSDADATPWTVSTNPTTTLFSVLNNEMRISNSTTTGTGVWTSGAIDITGKTNVSVSTQVRSSIINNAVMNEIGEYADYIRFYYKLNNGAEVLFAEKLGAINNHSTTPTPISISGLSGNSLQIVVRARATGNDEFYYFDNVQVVATGPANVTANATGGNLNCINNSVTLQGSSAASGASYAWRGPDGYTSSVQNPVVAAPGTYTLTVAVGSCTATATATVSQDTTHPDVTATASSMLTCIATSSTLSGSSSTPDVNYSWSNESGVIANTPETSVTSPGTYTLTVTNPNNGCSSTSNLVISQNIVAPLAIGSSNNEINCRRSSTELKGSSTTAGVTFLWTGPGTFSATSPNVTTTTAGNYTLTVTNPVNGCQGSIAIEVIQNVTPPSATATNNGPISCTTPEVTLTGSAAVSGLTYYWTGPFSFSSSSQVVGNITSPGIYNLTVTDNRVEGNGCSATYSTEVIEDFSDCFAAAASTARVATTQTASAETNINAGTATQLTYKAYPNPVITSGVIEFASPQSVNTNVSLYNALGTLEQVMFKGTVTANRLYRVVIPASQLPAGAYYYIINTGGKSYTGKLVIVK